MALYLCDNVNQESKIVVANSWGDAEAICELRELTLLGEYMGTVEADIEIFE